jgi:hypothetical protein
MDQKQSKATGADVAPPPPTAPERTVYVIVEERRKKKRKRGSSRASRRLAGVEKRVSKAARKVAAGVDSGANRYIARRKRSARRRRDGALVDLCTNVARGTARAVRKSSPALVKVAKIPNSKRLRKGIRRVLRGVPVII